MSICSKRFVKLLTFAAVVLVLAGLAANVLKYGFGHDYTFGFVPLFDLSSEQNIPTWFSSALLLLCVLVLWEIGAPTYLTERTYLGHWKGLSLFFAYLSMDETACIHERVGHFFRTHFPTGGIFYYSWVFFLGLPVAVLIFLLYFRFLRHLPAQIRNLFLLAAFFYAGGALGMEIVGGVIDFQGHKETLFYALCSTLEEIFEITGALTFLYALTGYYESCQLKTEAL